MSANGVRADGTAYQRTKFQAEQYLRASELDYAIFRPSVIFGPPRGRMEIATQLFQDVIRPPLPAPLFYSGILPTDAGGFRLSPVHVQEVAKAFADALDADEAGRQTFLLCGPEELTWREILQRIANAGGNPSKTMVPVPADLLRLGATLLDRFEAFPVTADQLRMLLEGNTCNPAAGATILIGERRFDAAELSYLSPND
jgi:NADH dehydrogenase